MRNYDLSVLFDSAKGEEDAKKLQTKLEDVIKKSGGTIYKSEFNGRIDLVNTLENTPKLTVHEFNTLQITKGWKH